MTDQENAQCEQTGAGNTGGPRRTAPGGPIRFVRRRVLPLIGRLAALTGLAMVAAWATGRVLTDQSLWSQYLWWAPTLWVLGAGVAVWAVSWVCGRLSIRMGGELARPVLGAALVVMFGELMLHEMRAYRIVRPAVDTSAPSVRLAFWNGASKANIWGAEADLAAYDADLTVAMNPTSGPNQLRGLLDALGGVVLDAPQEAESASGALEGVAPISPDVHLYQRHGVIIASKLPILRFGEVWVNKPEGGDPDWRTAWYGGRVQFLELDASSSMPGLGRPLVVWVIDTPSDPSYHRMVPAQKIREAVDAFNGPVWEPAGLGSLAARGAWAGGRGEGGVGFPEPDFVMGDFNTPRGSASLGVLVGDMSSAHAQGGFGPDWSWDQPFAWWAIDLMFVGEGWRARRFDAQMLHHHAHAVIVGDLVRTD